MRRAFLITLALVFVISSSISATAASARVFTSKNNISIDEDDGVVQQRRTTRRRARRGRAARRVINTAQPQPSPSTIPAQPLTAPTYEFMSQTDSLSVNEIDAAGLTGLLERSRMAANNTRRPLLVNFWATWCVPCREEFPDLVALDAEFRPRGLEFITISLDEATERTTTVPAFLREMRAIRMPAYLLNTPEPETAINAVDPTWSGALPATFLFDRNGQIVYKHFGRITPAEVRAAIERTIVAERPSSSPE